MVQFMTTIFIHTVDMLDVVTITMIRPRFRGQNGGRFWQDKTIHASSQYQYLCHHNDAQDNNTTTKKSQSHSFIVFFFRFSVYNINNIRQSVWVQVVYHSIEILWQDLSINSYMALPFTRNAQLSAVSSCFTILLGAEQIDSYAMTLVKNQS